MSKRPYPGSHERPDHNKDIYKRPRQDGDAASIVALKDLSQSADELIECLQSLKQWSASMDDTSLNEGGRRFLQAEQLSSLSGRILPSLYTLARCNGTTTDGREVALESAMSQPIPDIHAPPWKASDIPRTLPPLPVVRDAKIEKEAFHHPGVAGGPNYERLEWLGDAYLELIATTLISRTFPSMPSGRCSQVREQLVRNTTLADFFRKYDMGKKAVLPPEIMRASQPGRGRSADKDLIKTQGDMFEAYVAAIIVSDPDAGLQRCVGWLRDIWSVTIQDKIIEAEKDGPKRALAAKQPESGPPKVLKPKEELAKCIVVKGVKLEYRDQPGTGRKDPETKLMVFSVGVYLTGWGEQDKLLGWGSHINKKEAGNKAAEMALASGDKIKVYEQKKAAYLLEAEKARLAADVSQT